jgi:hypothetical protein
MRDRYDHPRYASPEDYARSFWPRCAGHEDCECPRCKPCSCCGTVPDYGDLDDAGLCTDCEGQHECEDCGEWSDDCDDDGFCPVCHVDNEDDLDVDTEAAQ